MESVPDPKMCITIVAQQKWAIKIAAVEFPDGGRNMLAT